MEAETIAEQQTLETVAQDLAGVTVREATVTCPWRISACIVRFGSVIFVRNSTLVKRFQSIKQVSETGFKI